MDACHRISGHDGGTRRLAIAAEFLPGARAGARAAS